MPVLPLQPDAGSLGDFEITPEIDARINALARRARRDPAARNELYQALGFKIERFVRRCSFRRARQLKVCEPPDIAQEAFLVFCALVDQWPEDGSFAGFFLSFFPRRLARAVEVLERGCTISRDAQQQALESIAREEFTLDVETGSLLVEVSAGLSSRDRVVLEMRVGQDLPLRQIARILGLHPRTIDRVWRQIVDDLRASLTWDGDSLRRERARKHRARPAT